MAEATKTIYQALMDAQRDFGPVLKNATNPHLKSKYADLGSVIETITEPLHKNGLVFTQLIQSSPDGAELVTMLILAATGDKLESRAPIVSKDPTNPQAFGAALTYIRRYSLLAMFGLAPEDDDGHAATKEPVKRTQREEPQTRTTATQTHEPSMSVSEFTEKFKLAMFAKDGQELRTLMDTAADSIPHWVAMVNLADHERQLEWVKEGMQKRGITGSEAFDKAYITRQEAIGK